MAQKRIDLPSRERLAEQLYVACHIKGSFTLRSGRRTNEYFDKYQFEARPALLRAVTEGLVGLVPTGTEVLAGLEMGGVPVVTMLSQLSGLPCAFVRKKAKEHGTARLSEGADVAGKKVLIIEDVVTSGGQISLSLADLRALGGVIESALCVIDRKEGGAELLAEHGVHLLSLFTRDDFPDL